MERNTRQRSAIREAIAQAGRPLLPQEVLDAAQDGAPGLSIATVYRNLRAMQDEGELQPVLLPGENPRYELAGHPHHHHFQCLSCQRVYEVDACPGDLSGLAPPGFTVEDHDLTLYGRCGQCVPAKAAKARSRGQAKAAAPAKLAAQGHAHSHEHAPAHAHPPAPPRKAVATRRPR